jgi:hypothetical protein
MRGRAVLLGAWGGLAAAVAVYVRLVRPWTKRWGATDEEVARVMPGDGIVHRAGYVATRAVTIRATPADVWPWLVQIGSGRAGWYSYDRLDNGGLPSAREILPAFQSLDVDQLVPMVPGDEVGVWVKEVEPGRRLLWWDRKGEYSWEWTLEAVPAGTRLVSRLRATYPPLLSTRTLYTAVATTGDIVMMRRCLLGIRDRAEAVAQSTGVRAAAALGGAA